MKCGTISSLHIPATFATHKPPNFPIYGQTSWFSPGSAVENTMTGWWFGTWILWLSIQLGISSSQLTKSIIFQRGSNHQPVIQLYALYCWKGLKVVERTPNRHVVAWFRKWEHSAWTRSCWYYGIPYASQIFHGDGNSIHVHVYYMIYIIYILYIV